MTIVIVSSTSIPLNSHELGHRSRPSSLPGKWSDLSQVPNADGFTWIWKDELKKMDLDKVDFFLCTD